MDEYERFMTRARAQWRARQKGDPSASLWRWEFWPIEDKERHHIARARYGELTILVPRSLHAELTRRQMEEHPPDGPDPTNPVEIAGRYDVGFADLFDCNADFLRSRGFGRIKAASLGKRVL